MDLDCLDISLGQHYEKRVIWIGFVYSRDLHQEMKKIKAKWSPLVKKWYVPYNAHYRSLLGITQAFQPSFMDQIAPDNQEQWQALKDQLELKGYAKTTCTTYLSEFGQFLKDLKQHRATELSPERLRSYLLYCIREKGFSESQIHSRLNALKFYYE